MLEMLGAAAPARAAAGDVLDGRLALSH